MAHSHLDTYKPRPKPIRYILGYLAMFIGSVVARTTVSGRHYLPKKGPFIVAINHFSRLDPAFIVFAIRRPMSILMASDQAVEWYFWWAPWLYGYIPTNRIKLAPSTIKLAKKALKDGEILGIFPEGTSTSDGIRPAKNGVVYLSAMTNAPIVPVSILGLSSAWKNLFRGVRPTVKIKIGKPFGPISLPKNKEQKEKAFKDVGDDLMCHIAALLPEENQGYLKNHAHLKKYGQ